MPALVHAHSLPAGAPDTPVTFLGVVHARDALLVTAQHFALAELQVLPEFATASRAAQGEHVPSDSMCGGKCQP